jgi:orotidine-5'-phosphate decarboxylase
MVGLDPIGELMPAELHHGGMEANIYTFLSAVIDITAEYCVGYKIQKAFFDQYAFGHSLLKKIINYCREKHTSKIIIMDCKIGDVEHTLKAYTTNLFDNLSCDGIVVNPYMGEEIFELAEKRKDKLFLFLVRTSNPGNALLQDVELLNKKRLWQYVLELVCRQWQKTGNCIPVLSFEDQAMADNIRQAIPAGMPVFWAGYGVQQRNLPDLKLLADQNGRGVLINSSRGILYSGYNGHDWKNAVSDNIINTRNAINQMR